MATTKTISLQVEFPVKLLKEAIRINDLVIPDAAAFEQYITTEKFKKELVDELLGCWRDTHVDTYNDTGDALAIMLDGVVDYED